MKNLFLDKSINYICKYQAYSDFDKKKLRYGLEGIYLTLTKMIVLIILATILNMLKEFILIMIFFNIIRYSGFGFHAEKSWQCLIFSTFNFIIIPYVLLHIELPSFIVFTICAIAMLHFILFAPADTKKRPLPNKKKRVIRKIITVLIGFIYIIAIIYLKNKMWTDILLTVLIVQSIIVSPITYWLFKQPYKNYIGLNTK